MMMMMMMIQVEPRETDRWTEVRFDSDDVAIPTSHVTVSIYQHSASAPRISDVTAEACIPRFGKYSIIYFLPLYVVFRIQTNLGRVHRNCTVFVDYSSRMKRKVLYLPLSNRSIISDVTAALVRYLLAVCIRLEPVYFSGFLFLAVSWTSWGYKISGRHDWS